MQRRNSTWPRIGVALLITIALGMVWGVAGLWLVAALDNFLDKDVPISYEELLITDEGIPVIQTVVHSGYRETHAEYRTLDGRPVKVLDGHLNGGSQLTMSNESGKISAVPIGWDERFAGFSDAERHGTGWYLVRPHEPLGPGYFVGYDEDSNRAIGYIGKNGFRPAAPPAEEWFNLPRRPLSYGGGVIAARYPMFGRRAENYLRNAPADAWDMGLRPWQVAVLDGNRLLEVDLRTRSVRSLREVAETACLSIIQEPRQAKNAAADDATAAAADSKETKVDDAAANNAASVYLPFIDIIAVRETERIVVIDPNTGTARSYPLPADLRQTLFNGAMTPDGSLLVTTWMRNGRRVQSELIWLAPDRGETRREVVPLPAPPQPSIGQTVWSVACMAPEPVVWLHGVALMFAYDPVVAGEEAVRAGGPAGILRQILPVALVLGTLSLIAAWLTQCLQRKYRRPATAAWCTFVFLFGPIGFLAYLIEHRRTKLETCPQCKATVPRDREACADCNTLFLPPQRIGTEIFA